VSGGERRRSRLMRLIFWMQQLARCARGLWLGFRRPQPRTARLTMVAVVAADTRAAVVELWMCVPSTGGGGGSSYVGGGYSSGRDQLVVGAPNTAGSDGSAVVTSVVCCAVAGYYSTVPASSGACTSVQLGVTAH
jgi:hypothetical protein